MKRSLQRDLLKPIMLIGNSWKTFHLGSSPLTVGVELLQLFEVYRGCHSIADSRDINPDEASNLDKHCVVHISPRSGLKSPWLSYSLQQSSNICLVHKLRMHHNVKGSENVIFLM